MPASDDSTAPIRRGHGLRLSTQAPPDETPATAAEPPPADASEPIARGRGLRLTTPASADPAPIVQAQAQVPSGLISYSSGGSGPPLLLLHGFGASGRLWRGVMEALGSQYTCYAPDLPGFGETPPRAAAPTLDTLAAEILAFADILGLDRFGLVGHSLGAAVAATLAGYYPRRVTRIALTSLGVRAFAPELITLIAARQPFDFALGFARPALNFWRLWTGWAMVTPPTALLLSAQLLAGPPADAQLWQEYLADHARADGRAYITSVASQSDPILKASLGAILAPTLLIVGREDRVARLPEVLVAQEMVAGARLQVIEQCGHLPPIERPAEYHAILRDFFGG